MQNWALVWSPVITECKHHLREGNPLNPCKLKGNFVRIFLWYCLHYSASILLRNIMNKVFFKVLSNPRQQQKSWQRHGSKKGTKAGILELCKEIQKSPSIKFYIFFFSSLIQFHSPHQWLQIRHYKVKVPMQSSVFHQVSHSTMILEKMKNLKCPSLILSSF